MSMSSPSHGRNPRRNHRNNINTNTNTNNGSNRNSNGYHGYSNGMNKSSSVTTSNNNNTNRSMAVGTRDGLGCHSVVMLVFVVLPAALMYTYGMALGVYSMARSSDCFLQDVVEDNASHANDNDKEDLHDSVIQSKGRESELSKDICVDERGDLQHTHHHDDGDAGQTTEKEVQTKKKSSSRRSHSVFGIYQSYHDGHHRHFHHHKRHLHHRHEHPRCHHHTARRRKTNKVVDVTTTSAQEWKDESSGEGVVCPWLITFCAMMEPFVPLVLLPPPTPTQHTMHQHHVTPTSTTNPPTIKTKPTPKPRNVFHLLTKPFRAALSNKQDKRSNKKNTKNNKQTNNPHPSTHQKGMLDDKDEALTAFQEQQTREKTSIINLAQRVRQAVQADTTITTTFEDYVQAVPWGGPHPRPNDNLHHSTDDKDKENNAYGHVPPQRQWWRTTYTTTTTTKDKKHNPLASLHDGELILRRYLHIMSWPSSLYTTPDAASSTPSQNQTQNMTVNYPYKLCKPPTGCPPEHSLLHTLSFRQAYQPWLVPPSLLLQGAPGWMYHRGYAHDGSALVWYRPGLMDPLVFARNTSLDGDTAEVRHAESYIRALMYTLEMAIADGLMRVDPPPPPYASTLAVSPPQSQSQSSKTTPTPTPPPTPPPAYAEGYGKYTVVLDCHLFQFRHHFPKLRHVKKTITMMQDHFPGRLGTLFIVNAAGAATLVLNIVRPLLTESVNKKIQIIAKADSSLSSRNNVLLQFMDIQTIPKWLGGQDDYEFDALEYYGEPNVSEEEAMEYMDRIPYHA